LKTSSFQRNKILSRPALHRIAAGCRSHGKKIVFTNGCFDLLHAGHVDYLGKAKRLGDLLIVGLNRDSSVRRIKGPRRPVTPEKDRLRILAALEAVDYVVLFSEETPINLIREIRPHVLVKGADWKKGEIVGGQDVRSWGGRVKRLRFLPGRSTTALLQKIRRKQ
jgi:D-beta-D-heptose 7-phosphate kinase/D-beta-D-heptose 1-phosphate adenosyltransferase